MSNNNNNSSEFESFNDSNSSIESRGRGQRVHNVVRRLNVS